MLRLVAYLIPVLAAAFALSWLADHPGNVQVVWQGTEVEISVFHAVVLLALLIGLSIMAWSLVVQVWNSPALIGQMFNRRRHARGLQALSAGMIAIGAGDRVEALRHAAQARKALPHEPLTHLLRAQAAELAGDRITSRRMFEAMLATPGTEQLGLRGLYLEAEREGEGEAARQFAERAVALNPKLGWPVDALFDLQCKDRDWDGALATLAIAQRNQIVARPVADRRRAVLLTAHAQALEDVNPDAALHMALEAHHLANDLIPAAAIAGRVLAARGHTRRATRVVERTWRRAPHPDLATVYAYARVGDSPRDRLDRVKRLGPLNQHSIETPIAIATAAIEARDWDTARRLLEPLVDDRRTQRVCTLMARIEGEQHGDQGRVRDWLARALHAARDPAWTADGRVSERWAPVSPVTGALDAFAWKVPASALEATDSAALARKLDELMRLGVQPGDSTSPRAGSTATQATSLDLEAAQTPAAAAVEARSAARSAARDDAPAVAPAEARAAIPAKTAGAGSPATVTATGGAIGSQVGQRDGSAGPAGARPADGAPAGATAKGAETGNARSGAARRADDIEVLDLRRRDLDTGTPEPGDASRTDHPAARTAGKHARIAIEQPAASRRSARPLEKFDPASMANGEMTVPAAPSAAPAGQSAGQPAVVANSGGAVQQAPSKTARPAPTSAAGGAFVPPRPPDDPGTEPDAIAPDDFDRDGARSQPEARGPAAKRSF